VDDAEEVVLEVRERSVVTSAFVGAGFAEDLLENAPPGALHEVRLVWSARGALVPDAATAAFLEKVALLLPPP
jgi:hypothetical protein